MDQKTRKFKDLPAVRERVPLLIGLMGPSGGGKTFSALRLATGIQRIAGGEIYVIDTESRRALHYADQFKFRHLAFGAPFGPLDYLAAIAHCVGKNAGVVIVDSMSHEHEGPGGVLEMHEKEVERLSGGDPAKAERVKMLAWSKPKSERRRLINTLLQLNSNFIFCFRSKEKIKLATGKQPEELGWMPIAGEEFIYEMTVNCLLPPNVRGVPEWKAEHRGEKAMMKLPIQFEKFFAESKPLDELMGEAMAKWATGAQIKLDEQPPDQKAQTLASIKDFLITKWPGQSSVEKENKAAALETFFGSRSWTQITNIPSQVLQQKLKEMEKELTERQPGDETEEPELPI